MMAWGTKQGILLDYKNGTAYFADDSGSGDTVYVYEQTGEGERNLIFQYEDSYQGLGAGRFIMDHYFVGVENFQIVTYSERQLLYLLYLQKYALLLGFLWRPAITASEHAY